MKHFFLAIFLFIGIVAGADNREDNIAVFVALDKSLSMQERFESVKTYLQTTIVEELIEPGDFLLIALFYGKTHVAVAQEIQDAQDKDTIKRTISALRADGRFTDIGTALDFMTEQITAHDVGDRKQVVYLITDRIQEAPWPSGYYSENGAIQHPLLEHAKMTDMGGWYVLSLGPQTEATIGQHADELSVMLSPRSEEAPRDLTGPSGTEAPVESDDKRNEEAPEHTDAESVQGETVRDTRVAGEPTTGEPQGESATKAPEDTGEPSASSSPESTTPSETTQQDASVQELPAAGDLRRRKTYLYGGVALAAGILGAATIVLLVRRRSRSKETEEEDTNTHAE